jgi:Kef-type K+ transport system membrane component KefB
MPDQHDILGHGTAYVVLIVGLFIVPQILERWRIPTAITSLGLGALMAMGFGLFQQDPVISLLSTFGIVALFLFAGLEVDLNLLREERKSIAQHVALRLVALAGLTVVANYVFGVGFRPAALVALAVLTPSTGFILSSLRGFGLDPGQERTVKSHAIASEIVALLVLFVVLRSGDITQLLIGILALAGMVVVVPLIFRWLHTWLLDRGPRAEFTFLVVMSIACASITKSLGAYYLLGAFLAGLIAQRTRMRVPGLVSERMVESVELFAVFFIPFYFLNAGLEMRLEDFSLKAVLTGLAVFVVVRPIWLLLVAGLRSRQQGESLSRAMRVGWALMPTLVFTLVIAQILRDGFAIPPELFGGLIVYALCTTLLPVVALGLSGRSLDFTAPEALDLPLTKQAVPPGTSTTSGPPT